MLAQLGRQSLPWIQDQGEVLMGNQAMSPAHPFSPVHCQTQLSRAFCRKIPVTHPRRHRSEVEVRCLLFARREV